MKVIGITGGIGSGKSTLSQLFEIWGIPVYIADTQAKKLMNDSIEIRKQLTREFGEAIYLENSLDRKKLASLIFNNPDNISYVNSIVHPAVYTDFQIWARKKKETTIAIESAILFDSGFDSFCNFKITVIAPLEVRIKRVMERDQLSEDEIKNRISNQLPDDERVSRSDFIVVNDEVQALIPQMKKITATFKAF
jgi:dephospho-CoA kinase